MDILCVVCGEPWDAYLDMLPWEKILFRKGAGCPCCKGKSNKAYDPLSGDENKGFSFNAIENGDGDPIERLHLLENRKNRPEWKRPDDEILWTCAICGIQSVIDADTGDCLYHVPHSAPAARWYYSHPHDGDEGEREPEHKIGEDCFCIHCTETCYVCGKPIIPSLEGDTYDEGMAFPLESYRQGMGTPYACIDCFETTCSECGCFPDDCDCHEEDEDGEETE